MGLFILTDISELLRKVIEVVIPETISDKQSEINNKKLIFIFIKFVLSVFEILEKVI